MPAYLFWPFALLMLVFGAAVVINRNPVASALSLVVSFLGLAALFMSLDAYFVGIIQVLVYAGAVMVLFLFIIMLLDLRAEVRRKINLVAFVGGLAVALALFVQIYSVVGQLGAAKQGFPPLRAAKMAIDGGLEMDIAAGLVWESQLFAALFATEDRAEGMTAFVEKRKPKFTGQ